MLSRIPWMGETVAPYPVFIEHISESKIGHTRALDSSESREGGAVSIDADEQLEPLSRAFERRPVERSGDAQKLLQLRPPAKAFAIVARAARD